MENNKGNQIGWFIIAIIIGIGLGYAWCYGQGVTSYDRVYNEVIADMDVLVKGELCQ